MACHCPWVLVWAGACYWCGVGAFMSNSSSSPLWLKAVEVASLVLLLRHCGFLGFTTRCSWPSIKPNLPYIWPNTWRVLGGAGYNNMAIFYCMMKERHELRACAWQWRVGSGFRATVLLRFIIYPCIHLLFRLFSIYHLLPGTMTTGILRVPTLLQRPIITTSPGFRSSLFAKMAPTAPAFCAVSAFTKKNAPWIDPAKHPPPYARWPETLGS